MEPSKTKIFIITPSLEGGGAERVLRNILKHLDKSRFEISLALPKGTKTVSIKT